MRLNLEAAELSLVLRAALGELLLESEEPMISSIDEIEDDKDFREYGMTSVDFAEFVILLEMKLDREIPDEAFSEVTLLTIDDWVAYLTKQ